jgi:acetate kinase
MGTRSGDIDPAIIPYLMEKLGLNAEEIAALLNSESGLKGLCGENDLRRVLDRAQDGEADAQLALEIFCYRIKKYIGAYTAVLGRVDAIVFTGGIGEHASPVRTKTLEGLDETFGIFLDSDANSGIQKDSTRSIHCKESRTALFVIPTDEELFIAQETRKLIEKR